MEHCEVTLMLDDGKCGVLLMVDQGKEWYSSTLSLSWFRNQCIARETSTRCEGDRGEGGMRNKRRGQMR